MSSSDIRPYLVAEVVAARLESPTSSPTATWTTLAAVAANTDLGSRRSFELRRLGGFVETYLQLFCPSSEWTIDEVTETGELIWSSDGACFGDLLVISSPRAAVLSREGRTASDRLFSAGVDVVRVLKLPAPLTSLIRTDRKAPPAPLVESGLWFGPASTPAAEVVVTAIGAA